MGVSASEGLFCVGIRDSPTARLGAGTVIGVDQSPNFYRFIGYRRGVLHTCPQSLLEPYISTGCFGCASAVM